MYISLEELLAFFMLIIALVRIVIEICNKKR